MIALLIAYGLVLLVLCAFGLHRAHLVWMWIRHRAQLQAAQANYSLPSETSLPSVTLQLPLYNEATVVERLLSAAAAIDYPHDRLEIQVLDDSTDETRTLAQRKTEQLAAQGINIRYVRRPSREGYKAGALEYGLASASGELVAVFDADFIPQPDFLKAIVGHFQDPQVGMVQTRWEHLNRSQSLLTEVQALLLDGHHLVENQARFSSGCFFNFSGTGGIWRKATIADAGGWEHDTLTEDLDLSYRAQMKGWRFIYRGDVVTPSELPEEVNAFRAQQYRWAKGTAQCARKLLGRVLRSPMTLEQRVEALFHLTPHAAYPAMLLLSILILPAVLIIPAGDIGTMLAVDLPLCFGATGSIATYFVMAERLQGRSGWGAIARLPTVIALGAGMSPLLAKAFIQGLRERHGEFVRTPKKGDRAGRYRQRARLPWTEMLLALVSLSGFVAALQTGHYFAAPFTGLFTLGYAYVGYFVISEQLASEDRATLVTSPQN